MNEQTEASNGYIAVATDLIKHFQSGPSTVRAVNGVSFRIPSGRIVAIRGASGCGKSTLLNLIGALDKPDSGELRVDGVDVPRLTGAPEVAYRRRKVGFVFQQFNLIPHLSALENVKLPMELEGDSKRASDEVAGALLRQVGLADELHRRRPAKLSGGEQQRVAIARALANNPPIILADEPTANLDSKTGRLIIDLLQALRRDDRTVIIATHDVDVAAKADAILEMSDGQIVSRSGD